MAEDLSKYHKPVGKLFRRACAAEDWSATG